MIVSRIEVQNLRRFVAPCGVTLAPGAINIVQAPNGSGKSTLVEALRMAFLTSHKSAGEEVRTLAPWGRALSPRVTVEFGADGSKWRVEKQWLQGAAATLEELRAGSWRKVAESAAAEERLRQFAGMPAGFDRGAKGKDAYWTSVLWSVQGGLKLDSVDASVVESVRSSLNQQMETAAAERIASAVRQFADVFWTDKTAKPRKNSPVTILGAERTRIELQIAGARAKLDELRTQREELLNLEAARGPIESKIKILTTELANAGTRLKQIAGLRGALEREQGDLRLIRQETETQQDLLKRWREVGERVRRSQDKLRELITQAGENPTEHAKALTGAIVKAEGTQRDALAYRAALQERDRQRAQLEQVQKLIEDAQRTSGEIEKLAAPSAKEWPALQRLWSDIGATRDRLEGALVHLEVRAERTLNVQVIEGEPEGAHSIPAGEALRVSGSPVVEVEVAGVGRWRASGPPASAGELRRKVNALESQWAAQTAVYQTGDFGVLQTRHAEALRLQESLTERQVHQRALLGGRTVVELSQALTATEAACAAHEATYPEWTDTPPDVPRIDEQLQHLRAQREDVQQRVQALRDAEALRTAMAIDEAQIAWWSAEHQSLEALNTQLDRMLLRMRGFELQVEELEKNLKQFPADLEAQAEMMRRELDYTQQQLATNREGTQRLRGRIEEQAAQAPYQSLAEAEEQAAELERKHTEATSDAQAALLLRATIDECRQEAMGGIADSVAREASALIASITGAPLGELKLSAELEPKALVPPEAGESVELKHLSGGENEQIHFATRLALADRLCEIEPQLAVFDDVLMATDPARLARILALLEERRERMQVLILTCHPERFAALSAAHRVELPPRG